MSRMASISKKFERGVGVLKRVCRVDVEEPTTVGPQLFDRDLRGCRPHRQHLFLHFPGLSHGLVVRVLEWLPIRIELRLFIGGWLEQWHRLVGAEVLHHPL